MHRLLCLVIVTQILQFAFGKTELATADCLKKHNDLSANIEFMANCKKTGKEDSDSEDENEHECYIMRRHCAMECSTSAYGGKCDVEIVFTLNLKVDSSGIYETLDCVCTYNSDTKGCYNTYQIGWKAVLTEFSNKCSSKTATTTVSSTTPVTTSSSPPTTTPTTTTTTTKPTTTTTTTTTTPTTTTPPPTTTTKTTTTTTTVIPSKIIIIGGEDDSAKSTIEIFYPDKSKENEIIKDVLLQPRRDHVSFSLKNGTILTCGGTLSSNCEAFDPIIKKSSIAGQLTIPRSGAGVSFLEGIPYVCGGMTTGGVTSSCELYTSGLWKDGPEMKIKRHSLAMASQDGYLYAIGGHDGNEYTITAERYNEAGNDWSLLDSTNSKRSVLAAAAFQGLLYVCGGVFNGVAIDACEIFDPQHGKWVPGSPMNHKRYGFNLVTAGGYLYAVGGGTLVVERYDVKKDKWTELEERIKNERVKSCAIGIN